MGAVQVFFDSSSLAYRLLVSLWSRSKLTFGRWSRKEGKAHFVTGIPDRMNDDLKQPALELYSWKLFLESGQEVRV
jgi:hypothetical protein